MTGRHRIQEQELALLVDLQKHGSAVRPDLEVEDADQGSSIRLLLDDLSELAELMSSHTAILEGATGVKMR